MAVLNDENQRNKGHTVLYLPNENLAGEIKQLISNKDLMQRLETTVIHWTRQIKDVLHTNQGETQGQTMELPSQGMISSSTHARLWYIVIRSVASKENSCFSVNNRHNCTQVANTK